MLGACCLAAASAGRSSVRATRPAHGDIGLQTITVLRDLGRDFAGTLSEVARIGYRNVETIGSFGRDPAAVRDTLSRNRLRSTTHGVCPAAFYGVMQAWSEGRIKMPTVFEQIRTVYSLARMPYVIEEAIAAAHALGQDTIVWASILDEDLATTAGVENIAAAFDRAGGQCAAAGLAFAFHNGSKGFVPVGGRRPYDILLERTDPRLVKMELDVYWAHKVGIDPLRYLADQPGRYTICHLKDIDAAGDIVGIGRGTIDFAAVLAAGDGAGIRHYFVEYDQAPHPIADAAEALQKLVRIAR